MAYASLEQRMAQTYMDLFPAFVPDEGAEVGVSEQALFYGLMKELYQLAFQEPLLFVPALHEDDAYPSRYKTPYGKPELQANMRKFTNAMDALLAVMYLAAREPAVKISKRQQSVLTRLGIADFGSLPAAWKWMATREGATLIDFSHCFFRKEYPYASDLYARLLGDEAAFRRLENWMIGQGYQRVDISDVPASGYKESLTYYKVSLTYANPAWGKDTPRRGFEYKIRHTGISTLYDPLVREPAVFGLCIPHGMKRYLDAFDAMDAQTQRFVMDHVKKCDGCGYCVQTDKTGKRPLAFVTVGFQEDKIAVCPYFPGYGFCWTRIDDGLVERVIEMLSFLDRFVPLDKA